MDLNGDGLKDMVSGSWPGEIYYFERKPSRMFAKGITLKTNRGDPLKVGSASAAAVADWNGDQLPDLILGEIQGAVFLVLNEGTASRPSFNHPTALQAGGRAIAVGGDAGPCVADWDGDGVMDLIVGDGQGTVTFYRNTGTATEPRLAAGVVMIEGGGYQTFDSADAPRGSSSRAKPAVVDWNGDGRLDLLVGDFFSVGVGDDRSTHGNVWVYLRKSGPPAPLGDVN